MVSCDYDFDRPQDAKVRLFVFRWVCRRPFVDPLGLNDTRVVARNENEALDYLLDSGGWRDRRGQSQNISRFYDVISETGAPPFDGDWREWTQAVHHGLYPRELVRLPAEALTQEVLDSRVVRAPTPKVRRKGFLEEAEGFLARQAQYRRFWKGAGLVAVGLAGVILLCLLWQVLLGLATTYIVVRAVLAGLRNS